MKKKNRLYLHLSKRESQIMDVIFQNGGEMSVSEVVSSLDNPSGYNSIRVLMNILEKKGYLTHRRDGQKYVYKAKEVAEKTKRSAIDHIVSTFFEGSTPKLLSTLLDMSAGKLSENELEELTEMIEQAKKRN